MSNRTKAWIGAFDATGKSVSTLSVEAPTEMVVDSSALVYLDVGTNAGAFSVAPTLTGMITDATTALQPGALAMSSLTVFVAFNNLSGSQVVRRWARGTTSGAAATSASFGAVLTAVDVDPSWVYVGTGSKVLTLPLAFAGDAVPSLLHDFGGGTIVTAIRSGPLLTFVATQGGPDGGVIYSFPASGAAGERAPTRAAAVPACEIPDMVTEPAAIYFLCMDRGIGSLWTVARK